MLGLIITVAFATGISALCSAIEAMLYSITWAQIEQMKVKYPKAGELFYEMRLNIEKPISAVLTLNTVANTAGATIAGALATQALGENNLLTFSILFTILILLFGEIIPKTIGVVYSTSLARILVYPLYSMILVLKPITFVIGFIAKLITPKGSVPSATEDDIKVIASLSRKSGVIQDYEETVISNILELDKKQVEDVMTPRTVVFSLPMTFTLEEAYNQENFWNFTRVPVFDTNNEDIVGIIQRREIMMNINSGKGNLKISEIMRPIHYVLEHQPLDIVMHKFLDLHQHLFAVLDEYGGLAGVISLEDILEEMLGREIVDESDMVTDMREAALLRKEKALSQSKNLINVSKTSSNHILVKPHLDNLKPKPSPKPYLKKNALQMKTEGNSLPQNNENKNE